MLPKAASAVEAAGPRFTYASVKECEARGNHRFEPKLWPPPKTAKSDKGVPYLPGRCTLCGVNLLVYEDNDPDRNHIEVVLPESAKAVKRPA